MTWRERLQSASFKGVSFLYKEVSNNFGRRYAIREFPGRDDLIATDLGRARREFTVEAFLVGDDYDRDRDELRRVIEEAGPGIFIHPYLGEIFAICNASGNSESTESGGFSSFSLTFTEVGKSLLPGQTKNFEKSTTISGNNFSTQGISTFSNTFNPLDAVESVRNEIVDATLDSMRAMNDANNLITAIPNAVNDAAFAIELLSINAKNVITAPESYADDIRSAAQNLYGSLQTAAGAVKALTDAVSAIFGFDGEEEDNEGPPKDPDALERKNKRIYTSCFYILNYSEICKAVTRLDYDSREESENLKLILLDQFDFLEGRLTDEDREEMLNLKEDTIGFLENVANALPTLNEFTPGRAIPALVATYLIYGNLDKEQDVVLRNNIRNPLAVSKTLEILIDA